MRRSPRIQEQQEKGARERAAHEAKLRSLGALLQTEAGRELVAHLADRFADRALVGATVEKTYMNLGRRDVVLYLRQVQGLRTEGKGTA